jgi:hypothetical protein
MLRHGSVSMIRGPGGTKDSVKPQVVQALFTSNSSDVVVSSLLVKPKVAQTYLSGFQAGFGLGVGDSSPCLLCVTVTEYKEDKERLRYGLPKIHRIKIKNATTLSLKKSMPLLQLERVVTADGGDLCISLVFSGQRMYEWIPLDNDVAARNNFVWWILEACRVLNEGSTPDANLRSDPAFRRISKDWVEMLTNENASQDLRANLSPVQKYFLTQLLTESFLDEESTQGAQVGVGLFDTLLF